MSLFFQLRLLPLAPTTKIVKGFKFPQRALRNGRNTFPLAGDVVPMPGIESSPSREPSGTRFPAPN